MHRHINYVEKTCGSDNMIDVMDEERNLVLSYDLQQLANSLYTDYSPIPVDRECLCRMSNDNLTTRSYRCTSCINIYRLCGFEDMHKDFSIEYGKHEGITMQLIKQENVKHYAKLQIDNDLLTICNLLSHQNNKRKLFLSDNFTNNVLITWHLQDIPNIRKLYSAFVCSNDSYLLYKSYKEIEIIFTPLLVKEILLQLIIICSLSQCDMKGVKLQITEDKYKMRFRGTDVKSKYSLIVYDFSNATLYHTKATFANKPQNLFEVTKMYILEEGKIVSHSYSKGNTVESGFYLLLMQLFRLSNFREIMIMHFSNFLENLCFLESSTEFDEELLSSCDKKYIRTDVLELAWCKIANSA